MIDKAVIVIMYILAYVVMWILGYKFINFILNWVAN